MSIESHRRAEGAFLHGDGGWATLPFEQATVVHASDELVVAMHQLRGRFTLRLPRTGLRPGDSVDLGGIDAGFGVPLVRCVRYRDPHGRAVHIVLSRTGSPVHQFAA